MSGYLSLFSGIGGLDLAVEAHGFRCVGQVEVEPSCAAVLERWWPGVPRWADVHDFTAAAYAERAGGRLDRRPGSPPTESSGLPTDAGWADHQPHLGCEAGTRSPDLIIGGYPCLPFSHAGKRGGTTDLRHLWPEFARLVGEFRPRWLLLENVPGHLSLGAAEVLADLAALGYDARWTTLRAADVGAPHRRERWFCLATDRERGEALAAASCGLHAEPDASGAVAPADAQDPDGWTGEPDLEEEARERGGQPRGFAWGPYEPAIRRWERVMGPAPIPVDERNRLSPSFVEWLMGFPAGWTDGMTRTQALRALGNAVVPQQGAAAFGLVAERSAG